VKRQTGFDADGNAQWSAGDLLVDTVFRFKGQAADAVVLTEIDFEELGPRERRRLFVALTRARLQVALVTSERAAQAIDARLGE
jgi:superfamily I DNA and RNA helicase